MHDFYDTDPKRGFYGGGGIDARIGPQPIIWAHADRRRRASAGAAEFKARLRGVPALDAWSASHGTSLPVATNTVDARSGAQGRVGLPAIRVTYKDHPDDLATTRFLQDRARGDHGGGGRAGSSNAPVRRRRRSLHLLGTCRMGNDPTNSVVDRYHRTHDVPNLFLCDGSSFVTSGRGQPTMTIQALAFRAAEHIANFARRGEI